MKKLNFWILASLLTVSFSIVGCSSAKKEEVKAAPAPVADATPAQPAPSAPADLGASSSGRGL